MSTLFTKTNLNAENVEKTINDDDPKRFKIVSEILSSEKKYVEHLNVLNSIYIVPIEASAKTADPILTPEKSNIIFGNLNVIKQLNGIFFFKLKERIMTWNKTSKIGDIFIDFVPYFKMYMSYVNNQESASKLLREQLKTNTRLTNFCAECDNNPLTQNQNIFSFLILPAQRIPRYEMLIKDLIKKTNPSHIDYEDLNTSHDLLKEVAIKIDMAIGEHKNRDIIFSIQESFLDDVVFLDPRRKFIHSGILTKVCRSSRKKYHFFLFSDILVYASKSGNKFKMHRQLEVNQAFKVENLPDLEKEVHRFQIVSSEKSFVVSADNYSGKEEWISAFNQVMDISSRKSISTKNATPEVAPVWQPDVSSKSCKICDTKFSVFKRRHHCRKCGELVCNDCSRGRGSVKKQENVRVCDNCIGEKSMRKSNAKMSENVINYNSHVALYNYPAKDVNELSLKRGQRVIIVHKDKSGWWTGMAGNQVGVFPSNYVSEGTFESGVSVESAKTPQTQTRHSTYAEPNIRPTPLTKQNTLPQTNFTTKPLPDKPFRQHSGLQATPLNLMKLPPINRNPQVALKSPLNKRPPPIPLARNKKSEMCNCLGEPGKNAPALNEMQVIALMDYTNSAKDELDFHQNDRLSLKYFNGERGWCYATNKETQQSGWVSREYISCGENLENLNFEYSTECSCQQFFPNAFRPTLCKECFHSVNSHVFDHS